jgi:hypothetical protein
MVASITAMPSPSGWPEVASDPGTSYGQTCDLGIDIVKDPVGVNDFHATLLHLLGIDHLRLTYPFQGRDFRLTDVGGKLVKGILA